LEQCKDDLKARSPVGVAAYGITPRAIFLGLLGSAIIAVAAPYAVHVRHGSTLDYDFSTPAALILLFLLAGGVNKLLSLVHLKALRSAELAVVYALMVVANAIPVMGFGSQVLPIITAPLYYATPENKWDQFLLPLIKPQLRPQSLKAVKEFYESAPYGHGIPWEAWLAPLAHWVAFILVLYFTMLCLAVLVHRQWSNRERLAYPLTQLPLELVKNAPTFLSNRLMWLGFAIPFGWGILKGLNFYFPGVPAPNLDVTFNTFRQSVPLTFRLSFPMLGFFYLVNLDTLFSLWFFNRLYYLAHGAMVLLALDWSEVTGIYGINYAPFKHIGEGAFVALVASNIWLARTHLAAIWRTAIGRKDGASDKNLPASYRVAVFGAIVGFILISAWLAWTGLHPLLAALFTALMLIIFLGLTRVVVESGFAEAVAPTTASDMVVALAGTRTLGDQGLMALALTYPYSSDIRTNVLTSAANGLKVVEEGKAIPKGLIWYLLLAAATSVVVALFYTLHLAYARGGINLHPWFFINGPQAPYNWVASMLDHPYKVRAGSVGLIIGGALFMFFLGWMRVRFLWWPFHPVGFAIGSVWLMNQQWLTALIAWTLKILLLRYGGLKLYRKLRPLFLGMILGQFSINVVWLIIDSFTGAVGNRVFWI